MRTILWALLMGLGLAATASAQGTLLDQVDDDDEEFTSTFNVSPSELSPTGANPFFILKPGYYLVLEGMEEGELVRVTIRVLCQTKTIAGIKTRVVEEREEKGGELVEVSRNYFAISTKTNSVFYFGEDVDIYENGVIVGHDGSWRHGKDGAKFGLMMPGTPLLGARYYQEIAPGVALDRAEIEDLNVTMNTPAGLFKKVLFTEETTPLEPGHVSLKYYAPGVGLIRDGIVKLKKFGYQ